MAQETSVGVNMTLQETSETHIRIRRGRVESVDLYEIKDSELELIERGSPADLQLNFAIFLISLAFSAGCSLATASFASTKVENVFVMVMVLGVIVGLYLLISWYRNRTSLKLICIRIRQRIPPDIAASDPPSIPGEDVIAPGGSYPPQH